MAAGAAPCSPLTGTGPEGELPPSHPGDDVTIYFDGESHDRHDHSQTVGSLLEAEIGVVVHAVILVHEHIRQVRVPVEERPGVYAGEDDRV